MEAGKGSDGNSGNAVATQTRRKSHEAAQCPIGDAFHLLRGELIVISPMPEISHFCLATGPLEPSLPVPCQESEEKQKHGKPLPSVSKSLEQGKFYVANKGLATCCKARTASASVVLGKLHSSPTLTLEMSERIFLFPVN